MKRVAIVTVMAGFVVASGFPSRNATAAEGKAVLIQVKNATAEDIFVVVDTGRIGDKVTPDKVKTQAGADGPSGLILAAGAEKSFGECIGLGDSPTLHAWKIKGGVLTAAGDFASTKFNATDYITIPPHAPPELKLDFDGAFKKQ